MVFNCISNESSVSNCISNVPTASNRSDVIDVSIAPDYVLLGPDVCIFLRLNLPKPLKNIRNVDVLERATGIEPVSLAWKAKVLPLHNARDIIILAA